MRRYPSAEELLGPVLALVVVGVVGSMSFVDAALEIEFRGALVSVAIVVGSSTNAHSCDNRTQSPQSPRVLWSPVETHERPDRHN